MQYSTLTGSNKRECVHLTGLREEDVAPLDVTVDHSVLLQVDQGVQHLLHNVAHLYRQISSDLLNAVFYLVLVQSAALPDQGGAELRHGAVAAELHAEPDAAIAPKYNMRGSK